MAIEYTYFCEGPDCAEHHGVGVADSTGEHEPGTDPAIAVGSPRSVRTATGPPYLPVGLIETRECAPGYEDEVHHFCSWDCAMRYAARMPTEQVVG